MTALIPLLAFLWTVAPQDSIKLQRTFKVGEVDRYQAKLSLGTEVGDIDIHLRTMQTVKSISANGEAELEGEILELKTMINGAEITAPPNSPNRKTTFKVDRFGVPTATSEKGGFGFNFLNFAGIVGDKPLIVGQKAPVSIQDQKDPKRKVTGDVLLESVKDGEAKLVSSWEVTVPENPKPLKIDMTSFVDVASGKLSKASGTASGISAAGTDVKAIQFSIERLK